MNYGFQNELDFVNLFNNKYLSELDENSQRFIRDIYGEEMKNDEPIKCWKNKIVQKADIFIKYKNSIKNISLKCGNSNFVHHEQIQEFERYLRSIGISYKVIEKYLGYHYGYKKDENGINDYNCQLSFEDYKKYYQKDIDEFNMAINRTRIIVDMIDRFIIRGRNSEYDIDALVCGKVDDYVWIKKHDIYDLILSNRCLEFTSPHIACMTIGPKKRCLNGMTNNIKDKYIVCIRWNFIREDIIKFKGC